MCLNEDFIHFGKMNLNDFQTHQDMHKIHQKQSAHSNMFLATLFPRSIGFCTYVYWLKCCIPVSRIQVRRDNCQAVFLSSNFSIYSCSVLHSFSPLCPLWLWEITTPTIIFVWKLQSHIFLALITTCLAISGAECQRSCKIKTKTEIEMHFGSTIGKSTLLKRLVSVIL